jgi:hypothetical protein
MHTIFTFQTKVDPAKIDALTHYLEKIHAELPKHSDELDTETRKQPDLPFERLTKVHFASLVMVPDDRYGGAYLVFENNIDGTVDAYIEQLCDVAPVALHNIYSNCAGYEAGGGFDRGRMRGYLRAHVVRPSAGFVGNVGRDVGRIHAEHDLRTEIQRHLDELGDANALGATPAAVYAQVRTHVATRFPWALEPQGRLSAREMFKRRLAVWALAWLALVTLPVLIPLIVLFLIVLRIHELRDRSEIPPPDPGQMAIVTAREDNILQNHFASIVDVKPGAFRRFTLWLVLFLASRAAALSVNGTLSNLNNIHFAHWVLIDGGRRMLFLTNYDGSWENYLDDFIDKASVGLTAIWSNTKLRGPLLNFPATWFLVNGGARDERNFKNIARESQLLSNVWYSAYRDITVPRADLNSAIRDGLAAPPQGTAIGDWLQRL